MYDGARVPSPDEGANGVTLQPETPAEEPEEEEGVHPKPVLVKKAHREILDHERKRRVELKCMELQEMMEEQGYTEEEIKQKVETFRQMLMEKEGVIMREGSNPRPPVRIMSHEDEGHDENNVCADGYEEDYNWDGEYYDHNSAAHDDYRSKRKSSSSRSPRPKKRKKKKTRRHSRAESSSPPRTDKKKKSSKKHKRDRSTSGSRRKRRHRSGSPKIKHKEKNKQKRSSLESPDRVDHHRGSCCSSRSGSVSSTVSVSKSPSRSDVKCRNDRLKQEGCHSPPPSPRTDQPITWQNGNHSVRVRNGKDSAEGDKANDKLRPLPSSPSSSQTLASSHLRGAKHPVVLPKSPVEPVPQTAQDACGDGKPPSESSGRRSGRPRVREKMNHSPAHSSDSQHEPHTKTKNEKKRKGSHSSKRHRRGRGQNHHRTSSMSPGRHKRTSKKKKSRSHGRQRASSWSSGRSSSRERDPSKSKSPHMRQNNSRERDSPHHSDTERARRRSRSYSPIRKRRRDSPSFMEARRITSARKRPIPYYRPSPSSSSSASSYSSSSRSRSRSRSYCSYSSYSSYSRSRSRSRSSAARSYCSQSSYESPAF
nr:serine/arginine repetitive matrix protein 3 [Misgurnus anguillicaudatus]